MNKYEQLIELIINEDETAAKALFHQIVVEQSRNIYESLQSDELGAEGLGDEIEDHNDEIEGDEFGGDDEFGGEEGADEFGGDDLGDEGSVEDRVMDLEDALDELKAEFDRLMGEEEAEGHDFGDDEGADEFGDEAEGEIEGELDAGDDEGEFDVADDEEGEEKGFGEASVYGKAQKTQTETMREYVEKVTKPSMETEGGAIGSGGTSTPINKKSVQISGKNDMGGTTANIAQGKFASDRDSNTGPKKPSNAYTKGETKMGQDKYENSPAANTKGYKDKKTAKTTEGNTTDGTVPVVKKSFNPGGKPGFKG